MKKLRGILVFVTAVSAALFIVLLQPAWNLSSAKYLQSVAARAGTNQAVATALPDYAASKLPDPDVAKAAFAKSATPASISETLDSLYESITQAYVGKTDVVEITITPLTIPVKANGYSIPPGTVFANDAIEVGGLAGILRLAQRSLVPMLIVSIALLVLTTLVGIKRGVVHSLRSVLMVTCLLLGGLFLATLILPTLISSLVASSGSDAGLRNIVLAYTNVLVADSGRYYISWVIVLAVVTIVVSILGGVSHRARRPGKKHKKSVIESEPKVKEL